MIMKVTYSQVFDKDAIDVFLQDANGAYVDDNGVRVGNRVPCCRIPGPVFFALMNGDYEQVAS